MLIILHHWNVAHYQINAKRKQLERIVAPLNHSLKELDSYSYSRLKSLAGMIRHSNVKEKTVYDILMTQLNQGRGLVRFAWINAQDKMVVTMASGIRNPASDLSHRDYVKQARKNPGNVITSPILTHIIYQNPVIIRAIGVAREDGAYLGTINAAINVPPLQQHISGFMQACQCAFAVYSPHGEWIDGIDDEVRLKPKANASFHALAAVSPSYTAAMYKQAVIEGGVWLLVWLGIVGTMVLHMRAHLSEHERQMKRHKALLKQARNQQRRWLQSATSELSDVVYAISTYSDHLEERVVHGQLDPDVPYWFDDVDEMGRNLRNVMGGFLVIDALASKEYVGHAKEVKLSALTSDILHEYNEAMERRNMRVDWQNCVAEMFITCDEHILTKVLDMVIQLLVRHGEDESVLLPLCQCSSEQVSFTLSRFRKSLLPVHQQDFGNLLPSYSYDMRADIEALLDSHVNVVVARSLLHAMGGQLTIAIDEDLAVQCEVQLGQIIMTDQDGLATA